jgi:hypothetical protein
MTIMTITEKNAARRRMAGLVSRGNVGEMCRRMSPTWTMEDGWPGLPAGHEGLHALLASFDSIKQEWSV